MQTQERDTVQLIDPAMVRRIVDMYGHDAADEGWNLVLENFETLKALKKFDSGFMFGLSYGMEHLKDVFYRFYDYDAECVLQCLVNDLGFSGERFEINFWARSGYLDHASSLDVLTSLKLVPDWGEDSEADAYVRRFDILSADQVTLMSTALKKNRSQIEPEVFASQSQFLDSLVTTLTSQPTSELRAAYIYQTR